MRARHAGGPNLSSLGRGQPRRIGRVLNHYHSKGTYTYTGPNLGAATAVNDFNGTFGTSNILPESPLVRSINMLPGSGVFNGHLRTGLSNELDFNSLRIKSVNSLAGFAPGSGEQILHDSSGGRWNGSMIGSQITMHLESITDGLSIRDSGGSVLMDTAGQFVNLGDGTAIDFTPIFTVASTVAEGTKFDAVFRLSDSGTGFGGEPWRDSGRFIFQVTAVPEPSSYALLGLGLFGAALIKRRRHANRHLQACG